MLEGPGAPGGLARPWVSDGVGLAPACLIEHHPQELAIAGDVRLTNAASVWADLGQGRPLPPSDAEIVLACYLRWGDELVERLEGDFAFALWDGPRRRLLCARDRFGVKAVYYHLAERTFAVASDAAALLALSEVPRRLNPAAIIDYLTGSFGDKRATGYLDVSRLPPAHVLVVEGSGVRLRQYWSLDGVGELRLGSDGDYEEAFRDALEAAVRARVGEVGDGLGISLSGGLDSSALACLASRLQSRPLLALTAVFDAHPASDERAWASRIVEVCNASHRLCRLDRTSPLAPWEGASWMGVSPACTPQIAVKQTVLEAAAEQGVAVVLSGLGGDQVVSHGPGYLTELMASGHVVRAAREVAALRRHQRWSSRRLTRHYLVGPFAPDLARRVWNGARARRPAIPVAALLRPEVARHRELHRRKPARSARERHVADLQAGSLPHLLEANARVDSAVGIEERYPFLDRHLVELCVSLPGDQKLRDGWSRSILRRALAGVVPDEVRHRPDKADLSRPFEHALATTDRGALEFVVSQPGALVEWVEPGALTQLWERCRSGGPDEDWYTLWRVAVAHRWLAHNFASSS